MSIIFGPGTKLCRILIWISNQIMIWFDLTPIWGWFDLICVLGRVDLILFFAGLGQNQKQNQQNHFWVPQGNWFWFCFSGKNKILLVLRRNAHKCRWLYSFLMILVPFESWDSGLSNGTRIVKNGVLQRKLWSIPVQVAFHEKWFCFWFCSNKIKINWFCWAQIDFVFDFVPALNYRTRIVPWAKTRTKMVPN